MYVQWSSRKLFHLIWFTKFAPKNSFCYKEVRNIFKMFFCFSKRTRKLSSTRRKLYYYSSVFCWRRRRRRRCKSWHFCKSCCCCCWSSCYWYFWQSFALSKRYANIFLQKQRNKKLFFASKASLLKIRQTTFDLTSLHLTTLRRLIVNPCVFWGRVTRFG